VPHVSNSDSHVSGRLTRATPPPVGTNLEMLCYSSAGSDRSWFLASVVGVTKHTMRVKWDVGGADTFYVYL
jgi:hypothetical protein